MAIERAYRAGVALADVQYVEAHSTATQLGDATELNTLMEILSQHFPPGKKIPITSLKANIGHSLETAGVAGVIKSVLVKTSDQVTQGQPLVVLEAMKMENQITAPMAGSVKSIDVDEGDSVKEGHVLLILE